jgi:hypothetical protein
MSLVSTLIILCSLFLILVSFSMYIYLYFID